MRCTTQRAVILVLKVTGLTFSGNHRFWCEVEGPVRASIRFGSLQELPVWLLLLGQRMSSFL